MSPSSPSPSRQTTITIATEGRGTVRFDDAIARFVDGTDVTSGIAHVFVHHTSASLIICENADPAVRRDLERFAARWVPDGDPMFEHADEGPDDMPAHVRSALTQTALNVPVRDGRLALGTWQGLFLWEHRARQHQRRLVLSIVGGD